MPVGRFAPSPTGRLHLGNLRTALVAWLAARSDRSRFVLRFEDLDTAAVRAEHYRSQPADLEAMGLDWDGRPIRQSERTGRYQEILDRLVADDAVYPCFCSRREIREAAQAPNSTGPGPPAGAEPGAGPRPGPGLETQPGPVPGYQGHRYPGTCRPRRNSSATSRT
jgi:glutamyl-tRNA synthetase